ncbi:MAG: hypothetical protein ACP5I7_06635 [Sulfolobales archaeon]
MTYSWSKTSFLDVIFIMVLLLDKVAEIVAEQLKKVGIEARPLS